LKRSNHHGVPVVSRLAAFNALDNKNQKAGAVDRTLFLNINRFASRTTWLHTPMRLYANYGIGVFALLLLAAWFIARSSETPLSNVASAAWAGAASVLALAINQPIGSLFHRARPYATLSNVHILLDKTTDVSFPSDHATVAGAVAVGLFLANRKLGSVAIVAALLMAFARVYAGVHYPGDVIAGLLLGAFVAVGLSGLGRRVITPLLSKLSSSALRTLVAPPQKGQA
jgi:membrane-associated phospholipid phosphatase